MQTKLVLGARIFFGAVFVIFGLNGFLQFIPVPQPTPEAGALLGAFAATGYFFPFIKIVEIVAGALILANKFVPFALAFIFPVVVGIVQIHLFLDPAGVVLPLILLAANLFLAKNYWSYFKSVMTMDAQPDA